MSCSCSTPRQKKTACCSADANHHHQHASSEASCCTSSHSLEHEHSHSHSHDPGHNHEHDHSHGDSSQELLLAGITFVLLAIGLALDHLITPSWFAGSWRAVWYIIAVLPVAWNTVIDGCKLLFVHGDFFNEVVLMLVATIGALAIGEYPEAVMLLLLYSIGEYLERRANHRARQSIATLIDTRPPTVTRLHHAERETIAPEQCAIGDRLLILPGERVALDGVLRSAHGTVDLSALTGESLPVELSQGDSVSAGAIVQSSAIEMEVTRAYSESTLARILDLVENAGENKPQTERFIRRFARVYTPIVFALASLVVIIPFVVSLWNPDFDYSFSHYSYKALVFLVTSCPCALIIGIPLSYYSGIGLASKHGLIFKGAKFLEVLPRITRFIFDKTGTLTEGRFEVIQEEQSTEPDEATRAALRSVLLSLEAQSTHPIAQALTQYLLAQGVTPSSETLHAQEIPGMGMQCSWGNSILLVGNKKLLAQHPIALPANHTHTASGSLIYVAWGGSVVFTYLLQDCLKATAHNTLSQLKRRGFATAMLSGDNAATVAEVGAKLGVDEAIGGLLPQDKINEMQRLRAHERTAFVGDGINDAPVMALSDISFAMGGMGSDAAIEAADVIIQSDDPYKTVQAVQIAQRTHTTVVSNIILILGIKFLIMLLALVNISTLVMAILADVGVTLLAILNAISLLRYRIKK